MPNMNPAVNQAGAIIRWNESDEMVIEASYGFEIIYNYKTGPSGNYVVWLVLNDEAGDFGTTSFIQATTVARGSSVVDYSAMASLHCSIRDPRSLPVNTHGKQYLEVIPMLQEGDVANPWNGPFHLVVVKATEASPVQPFMPNSSGENSYGDL